MVRFPSWGPIRTGTADTGDRAREATLREKTLETLEVGCGARELYLLLAPHRHSRAALFCP